MSDEPLHPPPESTDPVLNTGNQVLVGTPAAGTQLAGDVTGTTSAATVTAMQGHSIPAPTVTESGKVLRFNSVSGAMEWISPTAGGGGVSVADKSAFVEGTDSFTPIGGIFDEVLGADPAEDSAIVLRMTVKRAAHVNLRTATGTEMGTAGSPLRTDPTGGTTQPVSAASLPLPTGAATETTLGGVLKEGTDITGVSLPSGGASGRGWLSAIWKALTDRLPAALTGSGNLKVALVESTASQTVAGSVSVSNLAADQLVHAANLDLATSALRDAITAAGAAAKTLADVVTAITQVQAVNGAALPAQLGIAGAYDPDQGRVRPLPVAIIDGTPRATVDDARVRNELREIRLVLGELVDLQRMKD